MPGLNLPAVGGGGGGASIGGDVTGGTAGSVLFVATGPVLAQDNTNLFWDDTNDVLTASGGFIMSEAASVPGGVPGAGKGQIYLKNTAPTTLVYVDDADSEFVLGPTLDQAYDNPTAGAGRTITVDSGSFNLSQPAVAGGSPASRRIFEATGGAHTSLAKNVSLYEFYWDFNRTIEFDGNTGSTVDYTSVNVLAPTLVAVAAPFTVNAFTMAVRGSPTASTNVTATTRGSILTEGGVRFTSPQGEVTCTIGNYLNAQSDEDKLQILHNTSEQVSVNQDGQMTISPVYTGAGATNKDPALSVVQEAITVAPAGTNITQLHLDFSNEIAYANITPALNQKGVHIQSTTIKGTDNATPMTTAAGLYIDNGPIAGISVSGDDPIITANYTVWIDNSNAVATTETTATAASLYITGAPSASGGGAITNAYALLVDDGRVRTDGGRVEALSTIHDVNAGDYQILTSEHHVLGQDSGASGNSVVLPDNPDNGTVIHIHNANAANLLNIQRGGSTDTIGADALTNFDLEAAAGVALNYNLSATRWVANTKIDAHVTMYTAGGSTTQTTNGTTLLFDTLTGFASAGTAHNAAVNLDYSGSADRITVNISGDYLVTFQCSWTGTNNEIYEFGVWKNSNRITDLENAGQTANSRQLELSMKKKISTGADVGTGSFGAVITLAAGDTLEVGVNAVGTSSAFTPAEMQFTAVRQ